MQEIKKSEIINNMSPIRLLYLLISSKLND